MKRFVLILLAMALCASCAAAQETAVTKVRAPLYAGPQAQGTPQMTYVVGVTTPRSVPTPLTSV